MEILLKDYGSGFRVYDCEDIIRVEYSDGHIEYYDRGLWYSMESLGFIKEELK